MPKTLNPEDRKIQYPIRQRYIKEALLAGHNGIEDYIDALKTDLRKKTNQYGNLVRAQQQTQDKADE